MFLDRESYTEAAGDLCALFERSFERTLPISFLRWRYLDNPFGDLLVSVESREGAGFAAHYAASPVRMRIHSLDTRTALSMTTMTDPAYAGRGLFTKLARELYEAMAEQSFAMVWGFPNHNSHHGFVHRLGWEDVYEIPTMRVAVADARFDEGATAPTDDRFELEYEPRPDAAGIFVLKTPEYLRWRYAEHPLNAYSNIVVEEGGSVSSFCVVKRHGNDLDIVDFQSRDAVDGRELLARVLGYARGEGVAAVNCWAPRHHFMHGLCERTGFVNTEPVTYLGFRTLCGIPGTPISADYGDWYVQMGDSDVY